MAPPSTTHEVNVSSDGVLQIGIAQDSQNLAANTSQVHVYGAIENSGSRSFHSDATISCSISGTASFTGAPFSYDLSDGDSKVFIDHVFTITHGVDGTKSVSFTVHYGVTGTSTFPDNQSASASLTLTQIPKAPAKPGPPEFSNQMPTTVTVKWAASANNGGKAISSYKLRRYKGGSPSGSYVDSDANSLTRNVTGLVPGTEYTFTVYAFNGSADNGGYSDPSNPGSINMLAGIWVRVGGVWKVAVPFVRSGGVWKMAIPYVRSGGAWKQTN